MQTIADLISINSDIYVSPSELDERRRIEGGHSQHDDGSDVYFRHATGCIADYAEGERQPLDDHDPPARLCEWGLFVRYANLLEENGCTEIADVRSALLDPEEIPGWPMAGEVMREHVVRALALADEEKDCRRKEIP